MDRRIAALLIPLVLAGCGRKDAELWHQKYLDEVKFHHQSLQIKNAEIAARDMEVENQRAFIVILSDRINGLEKEKDAALAHVDKRAERGPLKDVTGKVTAVASEISLAVISLGRDDGVLPGEVFRVTREGKEIATLTVDKVEPKWSAGKVTDKKDNPKVGDTVAPKK